MTGIRRLLIAIDGSDYAQRAVDFVGALAPESGTELIILMVVEPLPPISIARDPFFGSHTRALIREYLEAQRRTAKGVVDAAAALLRRPGVNVEVLVRLGTPKREIVRISRQRRSDLIVLGARGLGGFMGLALGSVSHYVAEHATASVLVVKAHDDAGVVPVGRPWRVVAAVDGSPRSDAVIAFIECLAWSDVVHVRVVTVGEVGRLVPPEVANAAERRASQIAGHAVERLHAVFPGSEAVTRLGSAAAEIVELARTWPADLVVVGTRGRTGLRATILGSVSRQILAHAPFSVCVARSADVAGSNDAQHPRGQALPRVAP